MDQDWATQQVPYTKTYFFGRVKSNLLLPIGGWRYWRCGVLTYSEQLKTNLKIVQNSLLCASNHITFHHCQTALKMLVPHKTKKTEFCLKG